MSRNSRSNKDCRSAGSRAAVGVAFVLLLLLAGSAQASRLFTSGFETKNITETEWTLSTGTTIGFVGLNRSGNFSANVSSAYVGKELHTGYSSGALFSRTYFMWTNATGSDQAFRQILKWASPTSTFLDDTDANWNAGTRTNMTMHGTGADANLTSNSTAGSFSSQIFDASYSASWLNISVKTEAHYGVEIGRAINDTRNTTLPFVNTSGLVLLMHFNNESSFGENNTNFTDFSPYANSQPHAHNNGTCSGTTCPVYNFTDAKLGRGALSFDGVDDYVTAPDSNSLDATTGVTVSAWIYPLTTKVDSHIVAKWADESDPGAANYAYVLSTDDANANLLTFAVIDTLLTMDVCDSVETYSANQWTFLVGTYDRNDCKIYLNGVLNFQSGVGGASGNINTNTKDVRIGMDGELAGSTFFRGKIDEVAIFNRTLDAAEIQNLYRRGAMRLNLSVRTCDDGACSGEGFTLLPNTTFDRPVQVNLSANRYFQYQLNYSNNATNQTAFNVTVNNVTVDYGTPNPVLVAVNASSRKLQLRNSVTGNTRNLSASLINNTWYRMELAYNVSASSGGIELRIYQNDSLNLIENQSISGEQTVGGGVKSFYAGNIENAAMGNFYLDDVALNDQQGGFQSGFPGPGKIALLKPDSDVSVGWTRNTTGWYDLSWNSRKNITFNSSVIAENNLVDFPILINISDSDLSADARSDGYDILFTSGDGTTKLDHEIENYTAGNLVAWVRMPSLLNTTNQTIYMYYNNSAIGSQQNRTGVWNASFMGVWHFKEGAGTRANDSTSNNNNGTLRGASELPVWNITGKIGGSVTFDGTAKNISVPDSNSLDVFNNITLSAWVFKGPAVPDDFPCVLCKYNDGAAANYVMNYDSTAANIRQQLGNDVDTTNTASAASPSTNAWHYLVGIADSSTVRIYIDGVQQGSVSRTVATMVNNNKPLCIMSGGNTNTPNKACESDFVVGSIDEVRIMNRSMSAMQIKTEYNNQFSPSTFHSVQAEESATNYNNVDDIDEAVAPNDNTDSNYASANGLEDRLGLTNLQADVLANASITLVDVYARTGADAACADCMSLALWDENGLPFYGPLITLPNGWQGTATDDHLVYAGLGKNKTHVNSFNAGYRSAAGSANKKVTALWANVEWNELGTSLPREGINISSVASGNASSNAFSFNVSISLANLSRSFIHVAQTYSGFSYAARLINITLASLIRGQSNTNLTDVSYFVAEFDSGLRVFRGNATARAGFKAVYSEIPENVSLPKSFLLASWNSNESSQSENEKHMFFANFSDSKTLMFSRNDTKGESLIEWQVIEFFDTSGVQSGTASISGTAASAEVNLNRIDLTRSFPIIYWNASGTGGIEGRYMLRANLTNSTRLNVSRNAAAAGDRLDVSWFVVSLNHSNSSVQGFSRQSAGLQTNVTITAVNLSRAVIFPSFECLASSGTQNESACSGSAYFVNSTLVQLLRKNTTPDFLSTFYVVELPRTLPADLRVSFISPTDVNASLIARNWTFVNFSIVANTSDVASVRFEWNFSSKRTNVTIYNPSELVGLWHLNNDTLDYSGNGNGGIPTEPPSVSTFLDDTDANWNAGTRTNMTVRGTGADANLTSNSTAGSFSSQIFDASSSASWLNISVKTEAHYGVEIGRAINDTRNTTLPFVNTSGLVLLMHFNNESSFGENNTNFTDFSPYANSQPHAHNNGTCSGTTCPVYNFTDAKLGRGALSFDGVDDYVEIATSPSLNFAGSVTLSAWVYPRISNLYQSIIVKADGLASRQYAYYLSQNGMSQIFIAFGGTDIGDVIVSPGWSVNTWNHIVVTADGTNVKTYINSVLANTAASTLVSNTASGNVAIGKDIPNDGYRMNGLIDEVAIFNRTLDAAEIQNLYRRGAMRLNLSVRTCDDGACSGEGFTLLPNTTFDRPVQVNLSANRYFQYQLNYSNNATNQTAFNVTINNVTVGSLLEATGNLNCSTSIQGRFSSACEFDGVNDYINVPDSASLNTTSITVMGWVKKKPGNIPTDQRQAIASKLASNLSGGYALDFADDSNTEGVRFFVSETACKYNTALDTDWMHVTGTFDGSSLRVYTNGTLRATCALSGSIPLVSASLAIGRRPDGMYFNGTIDEVRIYSRNLSSDEINITYRSELGRYSGENTFYQNFTDMQAGQYNYRAYSRMNVIDGLGNNAYNVTNSTEIRTLFSNTIVCGVLATANSNYAMTANLSSSGSCVEIGANGITLDGKGYTINFSQVSTGIAVNVSGFNSITIKDLRIVLGNITLTSAVAVLLNNTNGTIINNVTIIAANGTAVLIGSNANNNTVVNNTLDVRSGTAISMAWSSTAPDDNLIYNNLLNASLWVNITSTGSKSNLWNTTKTTGRNIRGGGSLAGNYYANSTAGYSDTCADAIVDGICDSSLAHDANNTDYLALAPARVNMSFVLPTLESNTIRARNSTTVNVSISNTSDLASVRFEWNFSSKRTNVTIYNPSELVGLWHLNNDTTDYSGNGNSAASIGGVNCSTDIIGRFGTGCSLNGTNWLNVSRSASLDNITATITIELWAKQDSLLGAGNLSAFISKRTAGQSGNGFGFSAKNSFNGTAANVLTFTWYGVVDINSSASAFQNDLNWHHYAAAHNGTRVFFYVDGNLTNSTADTNTGNSGTNPLAIGKLNAQTGNIEVPERLWNGSLDEVRIYNKALSSDEINITYRSELGRYINSDTYFQNFTDMHAGNYSYRAYSEMKVYNKDGINTQNITNSTEQRTIYIGSVTCGLLTDSGTYSLVSSLSSAGNCFRFSSNDVTLDGKGYTINFSQSSAGIGINITGVNRITIKDLTITAGNLSLTNPVAILLNSTNNTILNNITVLLWNGTAVLLGQNAVNATIANSTLQARTGTGIGLTWSGVAPANASIYNNILNASTWVSVQTSSRSSLWNISSTAFRNTVSGPRIGGNYYTNSTRNGYSETCADADVNGFCDSSLQHDANNTDYLPLAKPRTNISFVLPTELNNVYKTRNWTLVNLSVSNTTPIESFGIEWNGTNITVFGRSLLGLWNFNNNTNDQSGNDNTGSISGANCSTSITGKFGTACEFDGIDDYINASDSISLNASGTITVMAWIRMPAGIPANQNRTVLSKITSLTGYMLDLSDSGDTEGVRFVVNSTVCKYNATLSSGWMHVAGTYNGTVITVYVDGSSGQSCAFTGGLATASAPLSIGRRPEGHFFNGTMDDVKIYNRSMTLAEINVLFRSETGRHYANITDSNLTTYSYYAWINQSGGEANRTEARTITFTAGAAVINLTAPTDSNASSVFRNWTLVNFTVTNATPVDSAGIEWNGTNITVWGDGLAGLWHMNNQTTDSSPYGNSGTSGGGLNCSAGVEGKFKSACDFNGLNDEINVSDSASLSTTSITVMGWVKKTASGIPTGQNRTVVSKGDISGYVLDMADMADTEGVRFVVNSSSCKYNATLPSSWVHVAGTYNGTDIVVYVDGLQRQSCSLTGSVPLGGVLSIGRRSTGHYFNGSLDEVTVFNRSLSSAELNVLFRSEIGRYYANITDNAFTPYNYYAWFNQSSGETARTEPRNIVFLQADLSIVNATNNTKLFANRTQFVITVSNNATSSVSGINVTCSVGSAFFYSYVIPDLGAAATNTSSCYLNATKGNQTINVTVDPFNTIAESNEANNVLLFNVSVSRMFSLSIAVNQTIVNTTKLLRVNGTALAWNGTGNDILANTRVNVTLNSKMVTDQHNEDTEAEFLLGTLTNLNSTGLKINLTSNVSSLFMEEFTNSGFYNRIFSNVSEGFSAGLIFHPDFMTGNVGNVTYRFDSETPLVVASAFLNTSAVIVVGGGNASLWYSYDAASWTMLASTTASSTRIGGSVPVAGRTTFYVKLENNKAAGDNAVTVFDVNQTRLTYTNGSLLSRALDFLVMTDYGTISWNTTEPGQTNITLQTRTSADNSTWSSFSSLYTNKSGESILSPRNRYMQFRAFLNTTNLSRTPELGSVTIRYSNYTTNGTGFYQVAFVVPSDDLGSLTLRTNVTADESVENSTAVAVWSSTVIGRNITKNYAGSEAKYTLDANFTRADINLNVFGLINITVSNSTRNLTRQCASASNCTQIFGMPSELGAGNYTVTVTATNESAFYTNVTDTYVDAFEEKKASGSLLVFNRSLTDFTTGTDYTFLHNATLENNGSASMTYVRMSHNPAATDSQFKSIVNTTSCPTVPIGGHCNMTFNVSIFGTTTAGSYFISWRSNWTNNDGTLGTALNLTMYTTIIGAPNFTVSRNNITASITHGTAKSEQINISSTGSTSVNNVNITFSADSMPSSWLSFSTAFYSFIAAANSRVVTVTINVTPHQAPGNYNGTIFVRTSDAGNKTVFVNVTVPTNATWFYVPTQNFSLSKNFSLSQAGDIGVIYVNNTGNIDLNFTVGYSPWGTTDYTGFGTQMFEENYNPGTGLRNPTVLFVAKNTSGNVTLYQKGRGSPFSNVGIKVNFTNGTALPPSNVTFVDFSIQETAPSVLWMIFSSASQANITTLERNTVAYIKAMVTDDVAINQTTAFFSIQSPGSNNTIAAVANSSEGTFNGPKALAINFTGNFTINATGQYSIRINVSDEAGLGTLSGQVNFTSVGTTTVAITANQTTHTITGVTQAASKNFTVSFTANNTGQVSAYNITMNFTLPAGWSISPSSVGISSRASGAFSTQNFTVTVLNGTAAGSHDVTNILAWKNPDTSASTDTKTLIITVNSTKGINISESTLAFTVGHGSNNTATFTVVNIGNDALTNISLACQSGTVCTGMTVGFNSTGFNLTAGKAANITVTVSVPQAFDPGLYSGTINASEDVSDTAQLAVTVPTNQSYTVTPLSINLTKTRGTQGNVVQMNVSNLGNIDLTFNVTTTNTTVFGANTSLLAVAKSGTGSVLVNFSAPLLPGKYAANISVTNSSLSIPQTNLSIVLTVPNFVVDILSPKETSPAINVTANATLNITAQATAEGANLTASVTWTALIGSTSCASISYSFNSTWRIACVLPDILDGVFYNLTLTGTNTNDATSHADIENKALFYKDKSGPKVNEKNATDNSIGGSVNLTLNVTDGTNVSSVRAVITYPNGTVQNVTLSLTAGTTGSGLFAVTVPSLTAKGDYVVNYTLNDTEGNNATATDVFEIFNLTSFTGNITDASRSSVNVSFRMIRPVDSKLIHNFSVLGYYSRDVRERVYDVNLSVYNSEILIKNLNVTKITDTFDFDRVDADDTKINVALYKPLSGVGVDTNLTENVTVLLNYTGETFTTEGNLRILKCASWSFYNKTCTGSWQVLDTGLNTKDNLASVNSSGFSVYLLAESTCGNGACEEFYSENTATCAADCKAAGTTNIIVQSQGGGGGGGGGSGQGLREEDLKKIEELLKAATFVGGVEIKTSSISVELFPGEEKQERIRVKNSLNKKVTLRVYPEGKIENFIKLAEPILDMKAGEERDYVINIKIPEETEPGRYDGNLILSSGNETVQIATTITVLEKKSKLLDLRMLPLAETISPGETLKLQVDLINLGETRRVDVIFGLELVDPETDAVLAASEETFAIETTYSSVKSIKIPEEAPFKRYFVRGSARFPDSTSAVTALTFINVQKDFLSRSLLGITYGQYILGASVIFANWIFYLLYRRRLEKKKRYRIKVDPKELPQASERSAFVGKIAETGIRAFADMDKMQTHTLVSGSTGSGKTVAAQVLVEEALKRGIAVIVFDPTAQWTGFLRKCVQKPMLSRYQYFEMKPDDAKAFKGTIKTIKNPREFINLEQYMKRPGEITVFNISGLDPKDIDIVVASTIQQVFRLNLEESNTLKALIVYDEVHRLLPKFGGSGIGFIQLERGAREFRKWGIGLLMISQVLSDFVGAIKANIGTEVQLRTRYEEDLERMKLKYGEDLSSSIVKAAVGTGMVVNSEYNRGRPYFVSFRPVLHSVSRLSNKELEEYDKYNARIEELAFQIKSLEQEKVDAFDMVTELKLASSKLAQGAFSIVDIYLDSLEPRVKKEWEKLGKKPPERAVQLISEEEIKAAVDLAERERKEYIKKEEKKAEQEKKEEKKEKTAKEITAEKIESAYKEMEKALDEKKKKGDDVGSVEVAMKAIPSDLKVAASSGEDDLKDLVGRANAIMKDLGLEKIEMPVIIKDESKEKKPKKDEKEKKEVKAKT